MKLIKERFLIYKLLNSSFTGLSIGILFTIYQPLKDPSIYSLGGVFLAIGMLIIAKFYDKLLNIYSFLNISLLVEIVILLTLLIFLILKYSLTSAILIYCGYQLTFIFGGYLVRAETIIAHDKYLLSKIDVNKQVGYLIGLISSYCYYKVLEYGFDISDGKIQISILHYFLILLQILIIFYLKLSFKKH